MYLKYKYEIRRYAAIKKNCRYSCALKWCVSLPMMRWSGTVQAVSRLPRTLIPSCCANNS